MIQAWLWRLHYELRYRLGKAPWDTGISPPELEAVIAGPGALAPGCMLDIGCGTGLNLVYAAQHGWQGVGVDYAAPAVAQAQQRAKTEGVMDQVRFVYGDVTKLGELGVEGPFDLLFDLGCFHGLSVDQQAGYIQAVAPVIRPGAMFLLYAFCPLRLSGFKRGVTPDEVRARVAPAFEIEAAVKGSNPAYWYTLRRTGS